jgi:DNA topoisomerase-3
MTVPIPISADKIDVDAYEVGQVVNAVSARYEAKRTTPPDPYDMATILDDMLAAGKFAKTKEDREVLKRVEGLGTSRTRQAIVDGLVKRGLLHTERRGKRHILRPHSLAMALCKALSPSITDVATTAKWELAFSMIESGQVDWRQVVDRQYLHVRQVVAEAKRQIGQIKFDSAGIVQTKKMA